MTARHCPGCKAYTRGWDATCPGVEISVMSDELAEPDVVPPLPFRYRLKVLLGLPVLLGVSAGPLDEAFRDDDAAAETSEIWIGPWKDTG